MANLTEQTLTKAREWAPWRPGLPWWIVLLEGIALAIMGLLIVINPATSSVNVAIGLVILLVVIGLIELWAVFRNRLSPGVNSIIAARGAIVVYAGIAILLMLVLDIGLSLEAGRVLFGLAATVFGVLGLFAYFGGARKHLRGILIDSSFFLLAGLLVLYTQWQGGEWVRRGTLWLGWISLLIGLGLIGFAVWRYRQNQTPHDDAAPAPSPVAPSEAPSAAAPVAMDDAATPAPAPDSTPAPAAEPQSPPAVDTTADTDLPQAQ